MKKLLFALFTFALVIIACEKDMDDYGTTNIAPIEAEVEVSSSDIDVDGLIDRLISSTQKNGKKVTSSTAKTAVRGTSIITIFTGVSNGFLYEIAFDDVVSWCNNSSGLTQLTLFLNSAGDTEIKVGDNSGPIVATVPGIEFLFTLDIAQGLRISAATRVLENAVNTAGVYSFTDATSYNFVCAAAGPAVTTYYDVTPAPFPLTGFLATINSTFTGTSANYAGTTEAAVRAAIEADILD